MATIVNQQITDAVTQTNVKVLAEAPAMALSNVYKAMAHSSAIQYEMMMQQQSNQVNQEITQPYAGLISKDEK